MYIWIDSLAPSSVLEEIDNYCSQHDIVIQDQRVYLAYHDLEPQGWQIRCDHPEKLDFLLIKYSQWITPQRGL